MKKTISTISMALLICITAIVFNGCKGKDGTNGAPGATGPQGNANVQSMTFTVNSTAWLYDATNVQYYANLSWSIINQDILDHGAVLVYQTNASGASTLNLQLPYTWYPSATYSETWTPYIILGAAQVVVRDSDITAPANPGTDGFKVVVMTNRMMLTNPHINFKDYESVRNAFHLRD